VRDGALVIIVELLLGALVATGASWRGYSIKLQRKAPKADAEPEGDKWRGPLDE